MSAKLRIKLEIKSIRDGSTTKKDDVSENTIPKQWKDHH